MIGILLAAGFSRRFGENNKLLHPLADGRPMGLAAAQNLIQAMPTAIAIVRPENHVLAELLMATGLQVFSCGALEREMADSLAAAVRYSSAFAAADEGLLIALADMPFIRPATILAVANALTSGAPIVVPTYQSQRGHPVGFAAKFRDELESLQGDEGARSILKRHASEVYTLACDDPGIVADIDTLSDLKA
ncbi:MAG: nucleotidyltransferase family protein [Methylophilaceae bacterium]